MQSLLLGFIIVKFANMSRSGWRWGRLSGCPSLLDSFKYISLNILNFVENFSLPKYNSEVNTKVKQKRIQLHRSKYIFLPLCWKSWIICVFQSGKEKIECIFFSVFNIYSNRRNYRIQGHSFPYHWITKAVIVICLVQQKILTNLHMLALNGPEFCSCYPAFFCCSRSVTKLSNLIW